MKYSEKLLFNWISCSIQLCAPSLNDVNVNFAQEQTHLISNFQYAFYAPDNEFGSNEMNSNRSRLRWAFYFLNELEYEKSMKIDRINGLGICMHS